MVNLLLDTNVVSEMRKRPSAVDVHFTDWARGQHLGSLHLSALTVMELEVGIRRLERRDEAAAAVLHTWFERAVLEGFAGRILPVDVDVARTAARLQVPSTRPYVVCLIGATALVHGMTVATRSVADFLPLGVDVVDPWRG